MVSRDYKFCPWCKSPLVEDVIDGKKRKRCPDCEFIYYKNPVPAAGGLIIEDGKILMVKRKYPPRKDYWSFPAGFMEWGETPTNCCIREVKEETGLDVEVTSSFKVYSGSDDPRTRAVLIMYITKVKGGELKAGDDASELKFFSFDRLPENIAFESHIRALAEYQNYVQTGDLPDPNE
jgi:ADP-ribose pyrophosphatase YjhB (NUDIX family)